MTKAINPWKTKGSKVIYDNPWIKVVENEVTNPSGGKGIYGVVHYKNIAVAVIPIDEDGNTYLIGQYRYTLDSYEWEIPMGGGSKKDSNLDSAKRELLEETGIVAQHWENILETQVSNSVSDEVSITYLAWGLRFENATPEETEDLKMKKLPLSEAITLAVNGEIKDAISVASLLKLNYLLENKLILSFKNKF
ncbi:MAG: ADP-ribose pyrophosphatase [Chitinophagales bacterium]|jgi:ADP-ribose pyrophosphatase